MPDTSPQCGFMCLFASTCVCVCVCFCYLIGTFSGINTDLVGTSSPHGDQSLVLMRENVISGVLVRVRVKM